MTGPAMTTWIIAYNDYASATVSSNSPRPNVIEIDAAYYDTKGHLVEFKDSDHQVVFAIHAGIISTIRRDDAAKQDEAIA